MPAVRPWYVIPLLGLAGAGAGFVATHQLALALVLGLAGAALAAAIRAFLGASPVGAIAAGGGALVGVLGLLALGHDVRAALAGAAAMFALSELVRAKLPADSPLPAVGAALLAGVLDPAYAGLIAVSGVAWLLAPVARPRGVIVVPILGVAAVALAVACALAASHAGAAAGSSAHGGLASLWHAWLGHATGHRDPLVTLIRAGDLIGPLVACAAIAGGALCLAHGRLAAVAVASILALTGVISLAGGFVAPATPLVAALGAGVAIGRFAALVRWPPGQAFVGATAGFVLAAVPVWTLF